MTVIGFSMEYDIPFVSPLYILEAMWVADSMELYVFHFDLFLFLQNV